MKSYEKHWKKQRKRMSRILNRPPHQDLLSVSEGYRLKKEVLEAVSLDRIDNASQTDSVWYRSLRCGKGWNFRIEQHSPWRLIRTAHPWDHDILSQKPPWWLPYRKEAELEFLQVVGVTLKAVQSETVKTDDTIIRPSLSLDRVELSTVSRSFDSVTISNSSEYFWYWSASACPPICEIVPKTGGLFPSDTVEVSILSTNQVGQGIIIFSTENGGEAVIQMSVTDEPSPILVHEIVIDAITSAFAE
jgi:hypothetical protein